MTPQKVEIWSEMLGDLTDEQFRRGIKSFCLAHRELFPGTNVIANIRHYAVKKHDKTAGEAWGDVLSEIRRTGSYGKPVFDELTQRAVDAVGWREMCLSENIAIERAHFLKAYDALVEREHFNAVVGV